jgi:hypothetical protein
MRHLWKLLALSALALFVLGLIAIASGDPNRNTFSRIGAAIDTSKHSPQGLPAVDGSISYPMSSNPGSEESLRNSMAYATPMAAETPAMARGLAPESSVGYDHFSGQPGVNVGRVAPSNYQSPLTAGQVDDNAKFDDYLFFLRNRDPNISVLPIDVEQRMFVRVLDGSQQPVAGARVQLFSGDHEVFDGRTMSDGRVLFLPRAAGAHNDQSFRALVTRGQTQAEANLKAGPLEQAVTLGVGDNNGPVNLDIVFLMDATGSMADEIDHIKATVDSIATRIEQLPGSTRPRLGLVAYRDIGDDYVSRAWDFTGSVQEFSANLANVEADNGGDYPEAVVTGLKDALALPGWRDNNSGRHLRLVILVGDAPPHLDYPNDPAYPQLLNEAVASGVKIFPIGASGLDSQGEYIFRQFAQVTQGQFVFLTYANGVSGAPGPATTHNVSDFSVRNLDHLVVQLVAGEVANQTGKGAGNNYDTQALALPPASEGWLMGMWHSVTSQVMSAGTIFWSLLFVGFFLVGKKASARLRQSAVGTLSTSDVFLLAEPNEGPFLSRARVVSLPDEDEPPADLTIYFGEERERVPVPVGGQGTSPLNRA